MSKPPVLFFVFIPLLFITDGYADTYKLRSPIGTNLDFVSMWSPELPFVDVMKSSSLWISADSAKRDTQWDNQQKIDIDENGWVRTLAPGQIVRSLTRRETGQPYPGGQYLVRYKGNGDLKFMFDAREISRKPGEIVLQVTPSEAGIGMIIEATDPGNHLRDIEITMPGGICEGDPFKLVNGAKQCGSRKFLSFADHSRNIIFNPVFLERLRSYSVLRFVDWMQTNQSIVTTWSQRTPSTYKTWATPGGAPIEVMIELANRVGAHPWFNMPHQADDEYARNFAQMVKAKLNPELRLYIEHSNEVWNGQFPQYAYLAKKAAAQSPSLDNMQYHALRSRVLGEIFKTTLGADRVVAVIAEQAANPATAVRGLSYLKSRFGSTLGVDAVAIAPYFGIMPDPATAPKITAMGLDALFDLARTSAVPTALGYVKNYRRIADDYKLRLISYEGGQHMVGVNNAQHNAELNKLFYAFNRDKRIKDLYLEYLAGWKKEGGELFLHYTDTSKYGIYGSWGALESITQPRVSAPKFDALQTFIENNTVWWTQ